MFEKNYEYIQHADLTKRFQSGANWFYWIAGLTLATSIIGQLGGGWRFFLSLEVTQLIDGMSVYAAERFETEAFKIVAVVSDLLIVVMFAGFGFLGNKRQMWAYVIGMVVFVLDALLAILIVDLLAILVHCIVSVMLIRGYMAGRELLALERTMAAETAQSAQSTAQAQPAPAPAGSF